jgi:hypothetical protein
MSKKVALLVSAEVMTRIVVEVADDFDVENLNENEFEKITNDAKHRLIGNLHNDYLDCITDISLDTECPHTDYIKAIREFVEENGKEGADEGVDYKAYPLEDDLEGNFAYSNHPESNRREKKKCHRVIDKEDRYNENH